MTGTATDAQAALKRIRFPALTAGDVVAFIWTVLLSLPTQASLLACLEAALILCLFLPTGLALELLVDRCRRYRPVKETLLQSAALKIVQIAFGFFEYRLGRVVFSDGASLALMHRRFGNERIFDQICVKIETPKVTGWWLGQPGRAQEMAEGKHRPHPSPVLFFACGGGMVMARPSFYLEFLHKLRVALSHSKPQLGDIMVFALEYPLAPEAVHPAQANSIRAAYQYLAKHPAVDSTRIFGMADSAGANLMLGLRLAIANCHQPEFSAYEGLPSPSALVLMSPFIELDFPSQKTKESSLTRNAPFDMVDPNTVGFYAQLFSGVSRPSDLPDGLVSFIRRKTTFALLYPQSNRPPKARKQSQAERDHRQLCRSDALLSPGDHVARLLKEGDGTRVPTLVTYGRGEVLADQSRRLLAALGDEGDELTAPSIHAWPMMLFNLGRNAEERGRGVLAIAQWLSQEHCQR